MGWDDGGIGRILARIGCGILGGRGRVLGRGGALEVSKDSLVLKHCVQEGRTVVQSIMFAFLHMKWSTAFIVLAPSIGLSFSTLLTYWFEACAGCCTT